MDWNALRNKRTSVSGVSSLPKLQQQQAHIRFPQGGNYTLANDSFYAQTAPVESRASHYSSQHPLFCADWISGPAGELVALSSFREGFQNRIQVVSGQSRRGSGGIGEEDAGEASSRGLGVSAAGSPLFTDGKHSPSNSSTISANDSFEFACAAETSVDYPVTSLQWEPRGHERLAASSEVLRLYQYSPEYGELVQTHLLANNSTAGGGSGSNSTDINTFPPVTAFDWNKSDPSLIITSSVDTTCTVWDLSRSHSLGKNDTAQVRTQLIAHDSEVFDVKFLHHSTNVFASVSNDGSMRVFDLRSLEHSTIIYEPSSATTDASLSPGLAGTHYNPQALLRLSASNEDQHHLATVGVNSNQVLIIDLRMPGVPVATIDGSFDGQSAAAINSIKWHPTKNLLATGGDDCQALVWDCSEQSPRPDRSIDTPVLAYSEDLEVNCVCWRRDSSWMGVVSGKGFQALHAG
ncbi:hypothetical protein OXX80_011454 [Metschnikowia pulcherrima]